MTFLAPVAGLVAAAASVPLLVLLYFLKLRRRPLRVSSTLLWDRAVQDLQVNAPFRWLRLSWLLALQLVALGLLLCAAARPAIRSGAAASERTVILIDRSASMGAMDMRGERGEPASRLDEAKRRALELIESARRGRGGWGTAQLGGSRIAVVEFATRPRILSGFTADASVLRDAARGVDQSDQPGDLGTALQLLESLQAGGADESERAGPLRAYLLSDGGFAPGSVRAVRGVEMRHIRIGAGGAEAGAETDNLGIVGINARRDLEDPAVVRIFARVINAGPRAVETTLQLRVNGELAQIRPLAIPGGASTGEAATSAPSGGGGPSVAGETGVTFELENSAGGLAVVSIARADELACDDAAGIVLSPSRRARVLVVSAPPPLEADAFLMGAFEAMDLAGLRQIDAARYAELARDEPGSRRGSAAAVLAQAWDLVVFDRVMPEEVPTIASISFGASLPGPGEPTVVPLEAGADFGAGHVVSWRRTHPVMRYVGLDQTIVSPPMRMTVAAEGEKVGDDRTTVLAWGPVGPLMALVESGAASARPVRRVVVGFELARSNWGPDFSFPVFVSNAVEYLTARGQGAAGRSVTTTEPVQVTGAAGATEVVVTGPRELRIQLDEPAEASLGLLDRAGVYRLTGTEEGGGVLAVNMCDERESLVRTGDITVPGAPVERAGGAKAAEGWREIWHWFVAAALALLTVEWFVYAWRMRM